MEEDKSNNNTKAIVTSIIFILILLLAIILTVYFVRERQSITPSANYPGGFEVSLENSYVFASPVRAKSGGDLIRVTIFVLDDQGRAVPDKQVRLGNNEGVLEIRETQSLTDEVGKAFFDISSNVAGNYYIQSMVEDLVLPQKIRLVFD